MIPPVKTGLPQSTQVAETRLVSMPYHVFRAIISSLDAPSIFSIRACSRQLNATVLLTKQGNYVRTTREIIGKIPVLTPYVEEVDSKILGQLLNRNPNSMRQIFSSVTVIHSSLARILAAHCEDDALLKLEQHPLVGKGDKLESGLTRAQSFILSTGKKACEMPVGTQKLRYFDSIIKLSQIMKKIRRCNDVEALCQEPFLFFGGIKKAIKLANKAKDLTIPTLLFAQLWTRVDQIAPVDLPLAIWLSKKVSETNGFFKRAFAEPHQKNHVKSSLNLSIIDAFCASKQFGNALNFIQANQHGFEETALKSLYDRLLENLTFFLKNNPPLLSLEALSQEICYSFLDADDLFSITDDHSRAKGAIFLALLGKYGEAKALALKIECENTQSESFADITLIIVSRGDMRDDLQALISYGETKGTHT